RCSYYIDLDVNKAEDVLLHRRILAECADPDNRPVFHARFLRYLHDDKPSDAESAPNQNGNCGGSLASNLRYRFTPPTHPLSNALPYTCLIIISSYRKNTRSSLVFILAPDKVSWA
uniref:Uncharacterized protein n=1 Tax=Aegilops tauschii subsp. strangulata TaxID=200361 RepID=A0A453DJ74_AEGTS